jgi:uncharacterized membrane protein SirB2
MMTLWLLKLHYLTVTLSLAGFILRGVWMMRDSPLLQARSVKVLPHINDALLIFSALGVAYSVDLYPWEQPWMAAKLVALMVYVLMGTVALKRGSTKAIRVVAWILALLVFTYIALVAMAHSPLPF